MSILEDYTRAQQRTYHDLVRAGLEILLAEGYDALNVSAITRLADYGRSTFYLYFKDKEDFVWTLMRDQAAQLDHYILNEVADLDFPERERKAWRIIFATIEQQAPFWRQLDGKTSHQLRQKQRFLLLELFEKNLREGHFQLPVDVPPAVGARYLLGASQEILEFWLFNPAAGDAKHMADMFCKLVYHIDPDEQP